MKKFKCACAAAFVATSLFVASAVNAADVKTYQVTGPVLEITPTTIVVQKGKDRWELRRDQNIKITGDLKVGAKVTITYTMVAQEVEVKPAKK
jgi:hypothetical protein